MKFESILPAEIERRSMEIIESEIGDMSAFSEHEKLIPESVKLKYKRFHKSA